MQLPVTKNIQQNKQQPHATNKDINADTTSQHYMETKMCTCISLADKACTITAFSALMLLVGRQEGIRHVKN